MREPAQKPAESAAVVVDGVSKSFGATKAVSDVSFSVARGSVHALLGENGAGKSTTMKILSGLLQPDAGAVRIDGEPVRLRSRGTRMPRGSRRPSRN